MCVLTILLLFLVYCNTYIQENKQTDIKWYRKTIRHNIYFELKTTPQDKLGRLTIKMTNIPPRVFNELFGKYKGTEWDGKTFIMEEKYSKPGHSTTTTKIPDGELPYGFLCSKFNNNLNFIVTGNDQIQRDLKKVDLTYSKPLGICILDAVTWWKMPNSDRWQSLE